MSVSNNHTPQRPYSLLILAGGEGRRMKGQDKGLIRWQNKPLIAHLIAALPQNYSQCLISCNRNIKQYQRFGHTITDGCLKYQGPLAGILAGIQKAEHDLLLVLPCDCPQPPKQLFQRLLTGMENSDGEICYAWDGHREQYLFALIKKSMQASLQNYLNQGQRSVKHWYRQEAAKQIDFSDCHGGFDNFNSEAALLKGL